MLTPVTQIMPEIEVVPDIRTDKVRDARRRIADGSIDGLIAHPKTVCGVDDAVRCLDAELQRHTGIVEWNFKWDEPGNGME